MKQSANEQLALRAIALVMAAGVGVWYGSQRSSPQWLVEEQAGVAEGRQEVGRLADRVDQESGRARRRATRLAPGEKIDPNTADVDELQRLPRVGPSLAARIIAHREANGPFASLADLDAVPGIGPALLEGITPHVTLPPAPAAPTTSAPARIGATVPAPASAPASVPRADQPGAGSRAATSAPAAGPVDINTATAEELKRLPGVGPVIAERIVAWRRENGPFRTVADLQKVPGIGPSKARQMGPHVRFGP
jgi:competence protein ComEA